MFLKSLPACALLLAFFVSACSNLEPKETPAPSPVTMVPAPGGADASAYRNKVFYEMWIRSFQDSNGDGIGDLKGATERLDELADLGIGAIWLMPTFPSPLADSGYDVADYYGVHPDYGTLADMDAFVAEAHKHGILVYLDMVFNHVSDQHDWFQSALAGPSSPYFDWFIWSPAPATRCADVVAGPFGNTRWTYIDAAGKYYFHQFFPRQPDLNFRTPAVQEELLNVLRYWMDRGVDGFRFDVPDRYFEVGNKCAHNPETIAFHGRLRETISGTGTLKRGFVGEIWGMHHEVKPFFGPEGNPMIFSFNFMYALYAIAQGAGPGPAAVLVEEMLRDLPEESRWGIFTGNHDTPRFASVASGDPKALRIAAALVMTLPGVPYIWMGDELGIPMGSDQNVDWRDGSRTPYPWVAGEAGHGFSDAKPHLDFAPYADTLAYDLQRRDPGSLLNYYRALISVRNAHPALQSGSYRELARDAGLWIYERKTDQETITVAHNFSRTRVAIMNQNGTDLITGSKLSGTTVLAPGQTVIVRP